MPLVTITQNIACGGIDIACRVAGELGVKLYDDRELKEAALRMGIRSEDLASLDEKAPGFFDRVLSRRPELYLDLMEAVVYEVARKGEGVILGHGSQILLRDFGCALHVFVHAPEAARVRNLMRRQLFSEASAQKIMEKSDNEQRGFFRYAFNLRMSDPSLYDLIVNTGKLGTDAAAALVTNAARSDEIKACSLEAVEAMERMVMAKKIRAALIENDINVSMLHIEVAEKNSAVVRGFTYTQDEKERIEAAVKGLPEPSRIQTEVSVMPSAGD